MEPRPLEFSELLARLNVEKKDNSDLVRNLHRKLLDLAQSNRLSEVGQQALGVMRSAASKNDRYLEAIAHAYLAAAYADDRRFQEAVVAANDAHSRFKRLGDQHNMAIARALLAAIYQKHLVELSQQVALSLREGRDESADMETKALAHNQIVEMTQYRQQFIEFSDQIRRVEWITALPYLMPLVWIPTYDHLPADLRESVEATGFVESVLFIIKTDEEMKAEEGQFDPRRMTDHLYMARPIQTPNQEDTSAAPPRLTQGVPYVAIKVEEGLASGDLKGGDYLLTRPLHDSEVVDLIERSGDDFTGVYFVRDQGGGVHLMNAIKPRFVGEQEARMIFAKVDAILRRIP